MYQRLLTLEKQFFDWTFISNEKWLNSVLHDDFMEWGKSGALSRKAETIEALLSCEGDRDITIRNFSCEELVENCWMVHYLTGGEGDTYYRTSLWVRADGALRLRFHQASEVK